MDDYWHIQTLSVVVYPVQHSQYGFRGRGLTVVRPGIVVVLTNVLLLLEVGMRNQIWVTDYRIVQKLHHTC